VEEDPDEDPVYGLEEVDAWGTVNTGLIWLSRLLRSVSLPLSYFLIFGYLASIESPPLLVGDCGTVFLLRLSGGGAYGEAGTELAGPPLLLPSLGARFGVSERRTGDEEDFGSGKRNTTGSLKSLVAS